jgi:hypothetical protein
LTSGAFASSPAGLRPGFAAWSIQSLKLTQPMSEACRGRRWRQARRRRSCGRFLSA